MLEFCKSKAYIEGHPKDAQDSPNNASRRRINCPSDTDSLRGNGAIEPDCDATASSAMIVAENQECPKSNPSNPDLFHEDGSPDVALLPPPWIASVSTTQRPGEYFYYNPETLESTFTHPLETDTSVRDSPSPSGTGSTAEVFPEHSVSSSYVPPVVPPAHAAPMHTGVPDVPADPSGSADAPGPDDYCIGRIAPSVRRMPCARPGGSPVTSLTPRQLIVVSPTETAAIWDMHRLGVMLAEATPLRPRDLLPYDWDYMSDEQKAMAIADAAKRSIKLRHDISLLASKESSLLFSEKIKSSGTGQVYDLCAPSAYEIGPSELSQILKIYDVDTSHLSQKICQQFQTYPSYKSHPRVVR